MIVRANRAGQEEPILDADLLLHVIADRVVLGERCPTPVVRCSRFTRVTSDAPMPMPVALMLLELVGDDL